MRHSLRLFIFTLLLTPLLALSAQAGDARLQVIHNAADPGAEVVDVYVNGDLFLDDFAFRTATPFVDVPAGVELVIGVAPGSSASADDILASFPVTLAEDRRYIVMANGVLDPGAFAANPEGFDIAFSLFPKSGAREESRWSKFVQFSAFHGATDAPTVDIRVRGWSWWPLVNDLSYGEFTRYKTLIPRTYILDVTPGNDRNTVVASFTADLSGLAGAAAIVFASGFLSPENNMDGAAFGLFAALPSGDVVELPRKMDTARLQVIHNAADPAAEVVDIYVNGDLFLDDFAFRTATPFVDVPAGVELAIGVAPGSSSGAGDIIATIPVTLEAEKTYIAVANGVLDPNMFAANPDGRAIGFALYPKADALEESSAYHKVSAAVFHGSTDAPAVDVIARGVSESPIVAGAAYGDFTDYLPLPPQEYILDITPTGMNETIVASYEVDLTGLGGGAALVFASGFLTPSANMDGAAFGLFAALPDGTVVEFPAYTPTARLQVIHNAADPAVDMVDIYVNGDLFLDDFAFRTATPFVDVPAGVELAIGVAPGTSSGAGDIIATIPVTLEAEMTYVAVANGVLDPGMFAENPDGFSIGFNIFARGGVRESTRYPWLINVMAFHGSTDAPTVDIVAKGFWTWRLFNNLEYGEFSSYRYLLPRSYILNVTPFDDNGTVVASFEADLRGLGGGAAVVFASGFLNAAANMNGEGFGLFAALPNGDVVEFPLVGGDGMALKGEETAGLPMQFELRQNYPNPFNPTTTISFALPKASNVTLKIFNVLGQEVETLVDEPMEAGIHELNFNAGTMASGMYFYRIKTDTEVETRKMVLLK